MRAEGRESDGGEEEGSGEGGSRETTGPSGENSGSESGVAVPQGEPSVIMRGEALLRQPRSRRPERPNSLDLSFTTQDLASLGDGLQLDGAFETGEKIKKRVKNTLLPEENRPKSSSAIYLRGGSLASEPSDTHV
ncbi:hypothetical protein KUCAC02_000990 [Chaenocephalus aceratus]|uniref:Uncharacterized protein n=1 Tax=Chaenocephalus aceratus TaxID=36190 RepID=A0ACB9XVX8_CHAAC|nr:hypothetical protein KUCAC02_000990 [Chaenocephalus aceratus]